MSEPIPTYTAVSRRGNRLEYQLTESEARLMEWIRRNSNGRWIGTIIYVNDSNTYQMFDGKAAGVANGNGRN